MHLGRASVQSIVEKPWWALELSAEEKARQWADLQHGYVVEVLKFERAFFPELEYYGSSGWRVICRFNWEYYP